MPPIQESQDELSISNDLFNAAFDEAVKGEAEPETPVEETPVEETPVEETPVAETPVAETPKVESAPPVDIEALIAAAVAAATKPKDEPVIPSTGSTPEELAAEEEYKKDWPEQYAREQRLRAQLDDVKALLATTTENLKGQIAPVIQAANVSAEQAHYNSIFAAHADAVAIVPDVEKWIAEQPKFLQPQYNAVLEKGSTAQVIELFDTYKKVTGTTVPDTKATEAAVQAEADRIARLNKMKTPTSIRTSVTAEEDADDFDSAFAAAAKKYKIAA